MRDYAIIGLTGPTGAGKSTVAKMFARQDFFTIDADKLAREAMLPDGVCLKQVCAVFGDDILNADGTLDRKALAAKAFSKPESTKLLNSITHPWILLRTLELCRECIDSGRRRILFDAPALLDSNLDIMCDAVVCVTAPEDIRLRRLMERDGLSREKILERMSAQHPDRYYTCRADFVVDGSRGLVDIEVYVRQIAEGFRRFA